MLLGASEIISCRVLPRWWKTLQALWWELRQRLRLRVIYLWVQTWLIIDLWTRIDAKNAVSVCREGLAVAQDVLPLAVAERHGEVGGCRSFSGAGVQASIVCAAMGGARDLVCCNGKRECRHWRHQRRWQVFGSENAVMEDARERSVVGESWGPRV